MKSRAVVSVRELAAVFTSRDALPTGSSPSECGVRWDGRVVTNADVAEKAGEIPGGPCVLVQQVVVAAARRDDVLRDE